MDNTFIKLPARFINDRVYVCPVTVDGTRLTFYTDSGGGGILIDPALVQQLNLPVRVQNSEDAEELRVSFPPFQNTASIPAGVEVDELIVIKDLPYGAWAESGSWGQGFLGATWFANRIWKVDYQNGEMGYLSEGEQYDSTGYRAIEVGFQRDGYGTPTMSFPRVQASVDGEVFDFLFDTGATVHLSRTVQERLGDGVQFRGTSFIVQSVFDKWRASHPDWLVVEEADELGKHPMIEVPAVTIAGFTVGPVWFTRRRDEDFHQFMSQGMDKQIEGALGGSAFKYFSIIMDYPKSVAYFKR